MRLRLLTLLMALLFLVSCKNPLGGSSGGSSLSPSYYPGLYAPLSVSSVSPTESFLRGGGTLTITGDGFRMGMSVQLGGLACGTLNVLSTTSATCIIPLKATPGTVDVIVTNFDSQSITLANAFTYRSDLFTQISTLTGKRTNNGADDGVGTQVRFNMPTQIVNYNNDDFYISDSGNNLIRKFKKSTGVITTVAGQVAVGGSSDGVGTAATFRHPLGMKIVGSDLYIADSTNCVIRKMNLTTNQVTTIAGIAGSCGNLADPNGLLANLYYPSSIDSNGTDLFVVVGTFTGDNALMRISLTAPHAVSKVKDFTEGVSGILVDSGTLYLSRACAIYSMNLNTLVETKVAGVGGGTCALYDAVGTAAKLGFVGTMEKIGNTLYFADAGNKAIRSFDLISGSVTTLAGARTGVAPSEIAVSGNLDGVGQSASLSQVTSIALLNFGGAQELYFVGYGYSNLRKINLTNNQVSTVAGKVGN